MNSGFEFFASISHGEAFLATPCIAHVSSCVVDSETALSCINFSLFRYVFVSGGSESFIIYVERLESVFVLPTGGAESHVRVVSQC